MNSRSLALASVFAISLLGATAPQPVIAQDEPLKIAVIDIDYVVAQSPSGAALNEKLQAFQKEAQGQVEAQQETIQGLRQKISEGVGTADQTELVELQKQFEDAALQLRRFRDDKNREAQKIQSEGLQEIRKKFEPIFNEIQDEFGYDLILNKQSGVVLMVGDRVDITQLVIDRLN